MDVTEFYNLVPIPGFKNNKAITTHADWILKIKFNLSIDT